ncbi:MAG: hydrogenase maturation nickel metallochaperone HypA [Phycisphaerae bacterium]|nr:hydrogenase maturation nickel metallochaperone HypA [Phycisphaerae bacterium]
MHEMSIAVELLTRLEELAVEHDLTRVHALTVRAGVLRGIVPEALDMAFAEAAGGTLAEGAKLTLQITPARARCRLCGERFAPTVDSFLCPRCNQADVEIIEGNEILLLSLDGASRDEN